MHKILKNAKNIAKDTILLTFETLENGYNSTAITKMLESLEILKICEKLKESEESEESEEKNEYKPYKKTDEIVIDYIKNDDTDEDIQRLLNCYINYNKSKKTYKETKEQKHLEDCVEHLKKVMSNYTKIFNDIWGNTDTEEEREVLKNWLSNQLMIKQ